MRRDILPWRRAIRPPGADERLQMFARPAGKNRAPRRGDRARRDSGGVPPESALRDFFLGLELSPLLGISASLTCSPRTCARGDDGLATRKRHKSCTGWNDGFETPGSAREGRNVALARPSPALFKTETMTLYFFPRFLAGNARVASPERAREPNVASFNTHRVGHVGRSEGIGVRACGDPERDRVDVRCVAWVGRGERCERDLLVSSSSDSAITAIFFRSFRGWTVRGQSRDCLVTT